MVSSGDDRGKSEGSDCGVSQEEGPTYARESLLTSPALIMRFSDNSTCSLFVYMYFLACWGLLTSVSALGQGSICLIEGASVTFTTTFDL